MKRNILVAMFALVLACAFSLTFSSCKKEEVPAPVVTEEKKVDTTTPAADDKSLIDKAKEEAAKASKKADAIKGSVPKF